MKLSSLSALSAFVTILVLCCLHFRRGFYHEGRIELDGLPSSGEGVNHVEVDDAGQKWLPTAPSVEEPQLEAATAKEESPFIVKVISEAWIGHDDLKAGRRRVRVVETSFKYPFLRLEERVWVDPETGRRTVKQTGASVADHLMVGLKDGGDEQVVAQALEESGFRVRTIESGAYILAVLPDFERADAQESGIVDIQSLDEFIDFAEPDYIVYATVEPNDPAFLEQKLWGLDNPGGVTGKSFDADIDAPEGWDSGNDASDVIVAVTDTGIRYDHEDLRDNMWVSPTGSHGYDAYDDDDDPMDLDGHGTHCAGTIGAKGNNGVGLTGVAWNVQLMGLRFLGANGGTTSDGVRVINYARQQGAQVISASWGGGGFSQSLYNAIMACYVADIVFVAAAGNDGVDTDSRPHYPSSYDLPNILSVASVNSMDELSSFSNYGRIDVDLAAPGSDIWSCGHESVSDYRYLSGTSMAAPHVSGATALLWARYPDEDVEEIVSRIVQTAQSLTGLQGKVGSGGRLNLLSLLNESGSVRYFDDVDRPKWFYGCYGFFCGSNARGTREEGEDIFSPDTGQKSLWFSWQAPEDGLVSFRGRGLNGDISVVAFKGAHKEDFVRVADNFAERSTPESVLRFYVRKGEQYRFSVDSRLNQPQLVIGELYLSPENDMFADATAIESDQFVIHAGNCGSTAERFEILRPHAGVGKGNSVWWKWTPSFTGQAVVSTEGSKFDTVLGVYTGIPSASTELGSNDDRSPTSDASEVVFGAVAGTTYYIAVDAFVFYPRGGEIVLSGSRVGELLIYQHPLGQEVSVGQSLLLDVGVLAGQGEVSYQWNFNGEPIPGAVHPKYSIAVVEAIHYGDYNVSVGFGDQALESEVAVVTEILKRPVILDLATSIVTTPGEDVAFRMRVSGSRPIVIKWFKDGVEIPGEEGLSLGFVGVQESDGGLYRVEVANAKGTAEQWLKLVVVDDPDFIWTSSQSEIPVDGEIIDIEHVDGEWIALSSHLLTSPNGVIWDAEWIPGGGQFVDLVADGESVIVFSKASGEISAQKFDDNEWTSIAPRLRGYPDYSWVGMKHAGLLEPVGEDPVILALVYPRVDFGHALVTTEDGVTWDRQQFTSLEGVPTEFPHLADLFVSPRRAFAWPSSAESWDLFASENGVDWVPILLPLEVNDKVETVHDMGDHFLAVTSSRRVFKTIDAASWQEVLVEPSYTIANPEIFFESPRGGYTMIRDEAVNYFAELPDGSLVWKSSSRTPLGQEKYTVSRRAGEELMIGSSFGRLVRHKLEDEFVQESTPVLSGHVTWAGGQFVSGAGEHVSSDGIRWKENESPQYAAAGAQHGISLPVGFIRGRYWMSLGAGYSQGRSPLTALPVEGAPGQVLTAIQMGEVVYALVFSGELYSQAAKGAPWVEVLGIKGDWRSKLIDWNGTLIVSYATDEAGANLGTWKYVGSPTLLSVEPIAAIGPDQALYTFTTTEVHRHTSRGGETEWSLAGIVGLSEVMSIDQGFLAIGNFQAESGSFERRLFFSENGIDWLPLELPFYPRLPVFDPISGRLVLSVGSAVFSANGSASQGPLLRFPAGRVDFKVDRFGHYLAAPVLQEGDEAIVKYQVWLDDDLVYEGSTFTEVNVPLSDGGVHYLVARVENSIGQVSEATGRFEVVDSGLTSSLIPVGDVSPFEFAQDLSVRVIGGREFLYSREFEVFYATNSLGDLERVTEFDSIDRIGNSTIYGRLPGIEVLGASAGKIYMSVDGLGWAEVFDHTDEFQAGWVNDGEIVFLGNSTMLRSRDGLHWSSTSHSIDVNRFLLMGTTLVGVNQRVNPTKLMYSIDAGRNWLAVPGLESSADPRPQYLVGNSQAGMMQDRGGHWLRSFDGITWDEMPGFQGDRIRATEGLFERIHEGLVVQTSYDGETWSDVNSSIYCVSIARIGDRFYGVGGNKFCYSLNGRDWIEILTNDGASIEIEKVVEYGGKVYALKAAVHSGPKSWWTVTGALVSPVGSFNYEGFEGLGDGYSTLDRGVERGNGEDFLIFDHDRTHMMVRSHQTSEWRILPLLDTDETVLGSFGGRFKRIELVGNGYLARDDHSLYQSTDKSHWENLSQLGREIDQVDEFDPDEVEWAIFGQKIYISRDGFTWELLPHPASLSGSSVPHQYLDGWFYGVFHAGGGVSAIYQSRLDGAWEMWDVVGSDFANGTTILSAVNGLLFSINSSNGGGWAYSSDGTAHQLPSWIKNEVYYRAGVYYVLRDSEVHYTTDLLSDNWHLWLAGVSQLFGDSPSLYIDDYADLPFMELGVEVSQSSVGEMGVGDRAGYTVGIRNVGALTSIASEYRLDLILSENRASGDADDLLIGSSLVEIPSLGPAAVHTLPGEFEIPEEIRPANFYLVARLTPTRASAEISLRNNTGFTTEQGVIVPGWELNLVSEGNGQVNRDFSARTYPQNARVSLTANAGKGAVFNGWGGDAEGGLSQISVLMDGNKEIMANFSSRAILQVHVIGGGRVANVADQGSYPHGDTAIVTAVPAAGWIFTGWGGAEYGSDPTMSILMNSHKFLTAHFLLTRDGWEGLYFSETELADLGISGDDADPDGDRLTNSQEYLHGSNPMDRMSVGVKSSSFGGGYFSIVFTRNTGVEGGRVLVSEGSRDLTDWNDPGFRERILSVKDGIETVEGRIPVLGGDRGFLRLNYKRQFSVSMEDWKAKYFSESELADPAVSGDEADADGDRLTNGQEYRHGSNPRSALSSGIIIQRAVDGFLTIVYTRNAALEGGRTVTSEASINLLDWSATGLQERVLWMENGVEYVEVRLPMDDESGFLRLRYK